MFDSTRIADDFSLAANRYGARAKLQAKIGDMLIQNAAPFMPKKAFLLDVGAGSGEVTMRWPAAQKIALDLAVGMCEEAQKKQLCVVNASASQLPIRSGVVDVVASNVMLQWMREPQAFLAESFRVLKAGGILAFSHFTQGTLSELSKAFTDAGQGARVSEFHAPELLLQQVKSAGFEVVFEQTQTLIEKYHGVMDLCAFIRDIGASNKRHDRPRGLLTPRALRQVTAAYPREGLGITASWVVQMIVARKSLVVSR